MKSFIITEEEKKHILSLYKKNNAVLKENETKSFSDIKVDEYDIIKNFYELFGFDFTPFKPRYNNKPNRTNITLRSIYGFNIIVLKINKKDQKEFDTIKKIVSDIGNNRLTINTEFLQKFKTNETEKKLLSLCLDDKIKNFKSTPNNSIEINLENEDCKVVFEFKSTNDNTNVKSFDVFFEKESKVFYSSENNANTLSINNVTIDDNDNIIIDDGGNKIFITGKEEPPVEEPSGETQITTEPEVSDEDVALSGVVYFDSDAKGIVFFEGVKVQLLNPKDRKLISEVVTDEKGEFLIDAKYGNYILEIIPNIVYFDKQSLKIDLYDDIKKQIKLTKSKKYIDRFKDEMITLPTLTFFNEPNNEESEVFVNSKSKVEYCKNYAKHYKDSVKNMIVNKTDLSKEKINIEKIKTAKKYLLECYKNPEVDKSTKQQIESFQNFGGKYEIFNL